MLLQASSSSFDVLAAWATLSGALCGIFMGVIMAEVSVHVEDRQRGRALGWVMSGQSLTLLIGVPMAAAVGSIIGWRGWLICVGGSPPRPAPRCSRRCPGPGARRRPQGSGRACGCPRIWGLLVSGVAERICYGIAAVYYATFLQVTYGLSLVALAIPLAVFAIGNFVGTLLGGQLADRLYDRLMTYIVCMAVSGFAAVALFMWHPSPAVSIALGFVYVLINALGRPSLMASYAAVPERVRGTVMGLSGAFASLGWCGAPAGRDHRPGRLRRLRLARLAALVAPSRLCRGRMLLVDLQEIIPAILRTMFDGSSTPELDPVERRARLRLARSPRVGPVTFHEALQHFGSARAACRRLAVVPEGEIAREEERLAALGGRFLVADEAAYPPALADLADAPPLSVMGNIALLGWPTLALVGAREASLAGRRFATELAGALGAAGFVIVSGLARGIDAAAHEASLATGTVAVLAGGIDQIYPPQHGGLQAAIAERGLLLSEAPFGAPPVARAFPRRNRIVSGLSAGVVVIEAAARSGSLITAQCAAEQGREVLVVPGSPSDPRYAGSNDLIRDGAILIRHANDIISVFSMPQPPPQTR
jgi:DNA processing protein